MMDEYRTKKTEIPNWMYTEEKYIPRCRMEELLTLFKDGLVEDDPESANEYFEETCELSPAEMKWLGLDEPDEE